MLKCTTSESEHDTIHPMESKTYLHPVVVVPGVDKDHEINQYPSQRMKKSNSDGSGRRKRGLFQTTVNTNKNQFSIIFGSQQFLLLFVLLSMYCCIEMIHGQTTTTTTVQTPVVATSPASPQWKKPTAPTSTSTNTTTTFAPTIDVTVYDDSSAPSMIPGEMATFVPSNVSTIPATTTPGGINSTVDPGDVLTTVSPSNITSSSSSSPTILPTPLPAPTSASNEPSEPTAEPTTEDLVSKTTKEPSIVSVTVSPTPVPQILLNKVIFLLTDMNGRLDNKSSIDFVSAIKGHIEYSILNRKDATELIQNLQVEISVDNQRIVDVRRNRSRQRRTRTTTRTTSRDRQLQLAPLQIVIFIQITFFSITTDEDVDASDWIQDAFNSNTDRGDFINRLQQRNSEFDTVTRVDVIVDGGEVSVDDVSSSAETDISSSTKDDNDNNKDDEMKWIIIGASIGGFIVLSLLLLLIRQQMKHSAKEASFKQKHTTTSPTTADETSKMGYAAEINVDRQDDISTLGDPVYGGHFGGMLVDDNEQQRDDYTASISPDYDYSKLYIGASGSGSMGTNTLNLTSSGDEQGGGTRGRLPTEETASTTFIPNLLHQQQPLGALGGGGGTSNNTGIFDDDVFGDQQPIFDQRIPSAVLQDTFEVEVPSGKLGMVIDTPNNGVPVVHAIKQESVLCDKVQVGDQLLSVDGEDVTNMTAVQVSKLISFKSDQNRILIFLRERELETSDSGTSIENNNQPLQQIPIQQQKQKTRK